MPDLPAVLSPVESTRSDLPAVASPAETTVSDLPVVVGDGRRRRPRPAVKVARVAAPATVVAAGVVMMVLGWQGSGPPQPPPEAAAGPPAPPVRVQPLGRSLPTRITIPKISVNAPIEPLGLNPDRTVETPTLTRPNLAGWYKNGPTPGQKGASVVLGHVDAHRHKAVFFQLGRLRHGDQIHIRRADGSTATFTVDSVTRVPKSRFPAQKVYGKTAYPTLRLVTCGGKYDKQTNHYLDNVIVYAHLTR